MTEEQMSLTASRHDIERRFHDEKAAAHSVDQNRDFYMAGGLDLVWESYLASIGDLRGKNVLDFGCGEGWATIQYGKRGANVYSFDISAESVRNLIKAAQDHGIAERIHTAVMGAESLGYPENSFDLVLGVAILHHTDPFAAGAEISRVLKPGGRALFIEPLAHNWFLKIFRLFTPHRRTPTEKPITVQQIAEFGKYFRTAQYRGYHLLSIFPQGLLLVTGSKQLFRWSLRITEAVDKWLLAVCPFLNRYCWSSIIVVAK
jgi:ubiquinone/menaquinone biosynthesis C-methylase UbiE